MKAYIYKQGDEAFIVPGEAASMCGITYEEVGLRDFREICYESNDWICHRKKNGVEQCIDFSYFMKYEDDGIKTIETTWYNIHIFDDDGVVFVTWYGEGYDGIRRYPSYEHFRNVACPPVE